MTVTVTARDAELALRIRARAEANRAAGCIEAARQLEALARYLLRLDREAA